MRSSRPTAAEQGEERKVWGSRSCHTQMTDCGGLFSSSFSGNPDALPSPPHSLFCRLPIVPCTWDSWRQRPTQPNTPTPVTRHSAHTKAAEPSPGPLDKFTAGQEGNDESSPSFLATRGSPRCAWCKRRDLPLPSEGWAPQKRAHATEQPILLVLLPQDGFLWLQLKVFC